MVSLVTVGNLQKVFDTIENKCRHGIYSLEWCVDFLDKLQEKASDDVKNHIAIHMNSRMKPRTLGEFFAWIYNKTNRQDADVHWWVPLYALCHPNIFKGSSFEIKDRGVGGRGNKGCLIVESDDFTDPDYLLSSEIATYLLEHKASPVLWKATYKLSELRSIKNGAIALTIHRDGFDDYNSPKIFYTLMLPETAEKISKLPKSRNFPGFRGKECVGLSDRGGKIDGCTYGKFSDYMDKFSIAKPGTIFQ